MSTRKYQHRLFVIILTAGGLLMTASCSRHPTRVLEAPEFLTKHFSNSYFQKPLADLELSDLRSVRCKADEIEVRLWTFKLFGLPMPSLTVLKKDDKSSMGKHIMYDWNDPIAEPQIISRMVDLHPKEGWASFWQTIDRERLFTMKGDLSPVDIRDGVEYLVEVNVGGQYRAYFSNNPQSQNSPHGKELAAMFDLITRKLGVDIANRQFYSERDKERKDLYRMKKAMEPHRLPVN